MSDILQQSEGAGVPPPLAGEGRVGGVGIVLYMLSTHPLPPPRKGEGEREGARR
jgi:hypothetical protein